MKDGKAGAREVWVGGMGVERPKAKEEFDAMAGKKKKMRLWYQEEMCAFKKVRER